MKLLQESLIKSSSGTFTISSNGNIVLDLSTSASSKIVIVAAICTSEAYVIVPYKNLSTSRWCCKVIKASAATLTQVTSGDIDITYYYMNI